MRPSLPGFHHLRVRGNVFFRAVPAGEMTNAINLEREKRWVRWTPSCRKCCGKTPFLFSLIVQGEICAQRKHTVVSKKIFIKREDVLTKV